MKNFDFLYELGFQNTAPPISDELELLQVDRVYYSGKFPAVFFKQVSNFREKEIKEIAKIRGKIWNYKKVLFLYVSSPTEIRIYDCTQKPFNFNDQDIDIHNELKKYELAVCIKDDQKKLKEFSEIFSAIAIDSGSIWLSNKKEYREKIDLQARVDKKLIESMLKTARILKRKKLDPIAVHSILIRSIFIMYLEDRGAIPKELYIKADSYLELLDNIDAVYSFYKHIEKHFNGNVFPVTDAEKNQIRKEHLQIIRNFLYDGEPNKEKLFNWRLFDFSIIPVQLLSEIYEKFLNEFDSKGKKRKGAFYTPQSLVDLVLDRILPTSVTDTKYDLKIFDPACGSGIFLVEAYKRIVKRWQNANPHKKVNFKILSTIVQNSIFGAEIEESAIKVSAFSLYLSMLDFLEPKDLWLKEGERFPYLIHTSKNDINNKEGKNLFLTNSILEKREFEKKKYDIIVGNPPFGGKSIPQYAKDYVKKYRFASEFAIPFIHKSAVLTENGSLAMIFKTKLLTNTSETCQNFRKWLFKDCYVEAVYNLSILRKSPKTFGGQLFASAVGPISIVFFSPKWPQKPIKTIQYWAPKTFVKNNVIDGIVSDNSDFKYLPREICQQPDNKIWKIAQWGTLADFFFIERLKETANINSVIDSENSGVGFQLLNNSTKKIFTDQDISKFKFILPENIQRYYTNPNNLSSIKKAIKTDASKKIYLTFYKKKEISGLPNIEHFRLTGCKMAYGAPHILIKEGMEKKRICSSFFEQSCSFNSKVYGIYNKNKKLLKALTCYLNSDFAMYFLFLTSSGWGVEREEITPIEIKALPTLPEDCIIELAVIYDKIIEILKNRINDSEQGIFNQKKQNKDLNADLDEYKKKADRIISKALNISLEEEILISDMLDYILGLFFDGQKAEALKPISYNNQEIAAYSQIIGDKINNFLTTSDIRANIRYYISAKTPICLIVIQFVKSSNAAEPQPINSDEEIADCLDKISEFTIEKYSCNIYVQKQIRFYDQDRIFILKPNQKRYWTCSQGIEDASIIISDIIGQGE